MVYLGIVSKGNIVGSCLDELFDSGGGGYFIVCLFLFFFSLVWWGNYGIGAP